MTLLTVYVLSDQAGEYKHPRHHRGETFHHSGPDMDHHFALSCEYYSEDTMGRSHKLSLYVTLRTSLAKGQSFLFF